MVVSRETSHVTTKPKYHDLTDILFTSTGVVFSVGTSMSWSCSSCFALCRGPDRRGSSRQHLSWARPETATLSWFAPGGAPESAGARRRRRRPAAWQRMWPSPTRHCMPRSSVATTIGYYFLTPAPSLGLDRTCAARKEL